MNAAVRLLLCGVVAVASMLSFAAGPARADGLDAQRKRVAAAISENQQQLDQHNEQLARAKSALSRSEAELTRAKAQLAEARADRLRAETDDHVLQSAVQKAESTLAVTEVAVELGDQKLRREQQIAGAVVRQTTQQNGPLIGVAAFVTNLTTGDVNEQLQWSTTLFNTTQSQMDGLQSLQFQVESAQQAQQVAQAKVTEARKAAAAHVVQTRQAEDRATRLQAEVSARVKANRAAERDYQVQLANDLARQSALQVEAAAVQLKIKARMSRLGAFQWTSPSASDYFAFPVSGPITSPYGMRVHPVTGQYKLHDGTDFGVACGTPIRAPRDGVVAEEYYNAGYGNRLMLDHGVIGGHFITTGYNHAERYTVSVGQSVSAGEVIGYVGTTGYSTGCHLHLMVWQDGTVVNPMARWF